MTGVATSQENLGGRIVLQEGSFARAWVITDSSIVDLDTISFTARKNTNQLDFINTIKGGTNDTLKVLRANLTGDTAIDSAFKYRVAILNGSTDDEVIDNPPPRKGKIQYSASVRVFQTITSELFKQSTLAGVNKVLKQNLLWHNGTGEVFDLTDQTSTEYTINVADILSDYSIDNNINLPSNVSLTALILSLIHI